jgi:hypothetical protein
VTVLAPQGARAGEDLSHRGTAVALDTVFPDAESGAGAPAAALDGWGLSLSPAR